MIAKVFPICHLRIVCCFRLCARGLCSGPQKDLALYKCPNIERDVCPTDECHIGPDSKQPKVVIIGAGIAGLSAAQRLVQCGVKNIVILEGSNRVGGRVHPCMFNDCNVELGAQWIYGSSIVNPIFNLAAQECLLKHPVKTVDPYRGIFFTSSGFPIDNYIYSRALQIYNKLKKNAINIFGQANRPKESHFTLWEYMVDAIDKELGTMTENEKFLSSRVLFGLTNDIRARIGADLNEVPLERYVRSHNIPGGDTSVPKGFSNVLKSLVKIIPEGSIKFNKIAEYVIWCTGGCTGNDRAMVITKDSGIFKADFVIVTFSLGVLKTCYKTMFYPPLPPGKVEAIQKLGYGHINKVFLQFIKPFWLKGEGFLRPSWSYEEISERCEKWVRSIGLIEEAPGCPNVLTFSIGGPEAVLLEQSCDRDLIQNVMRLIHGFTGDKSLPFPESMMRSKWSCDPLFLGAVSYLGKCATPGHQIELSRSIPGICDSIAPTLLFAGEATVQGHQATVHGARLSGIREAETILKITKRFKGPPPLDSKNRCD